MHIDQNQEERILVYKYHRHTLLALITEYPDFPAAGVKKILRIIAEALKELHDKSWIHLGMMLKHSILCPCDLFTDWSCVIARCET